MNRHEIIINKFEKKHNVKVGCYDSRFYYDGRSYLDLHVIGEPLDVWHSINTAAADLEEWTEEPETYKPGAYYIRGRIIADRLVKEALNSMDFSAVTDLDVFNNIISNMYDDEIEAIVNAETTEEAREHVKNDRDHIEHAMSESCMDDDEILDEILDGDIYKHLDHLGLYDVNVDVVSHAIEEAADVIQNKIDAAHFVFVI